jgi:ribonuclease Z
VTADAATAPRPADGQEGADPGGNRLSVTLTGTGTPKPWPGRAGAGTLVRAGNLALQFDAGRGTTLRLAEAGVGSDGLSALFVTHHHSDHCVDIDDIVISRWVQRAPALPIVAPAGPLDAFGERLLDIWVDDVAIRRQVTGRQAIDLDWRSFTATDRPQEVWRHEDVVVTGVLVEHRPVEPAVGYRVDALDASIVISGDTRVCAQIESLAEGSDVLVHEVVLPDHVRGDRSIIDYHADAEDLGAMAQRAGVGMLMLTHLEPSPDSPELAAAFEEAVRSGGYTGPLLVGHDLLTYDVVAGKTLAWGAR